MNEALRLRLEKAVTSLVSANSMTSDRRTPLWLRQEIADLQEDIAEKVIAIIEGVATTYVTGAVHHGKNAAHLAGRGPAVPNKR